MKQENFIGKVRYILKNGVEEFGTRYYSQSKLVYHYWSRGYTDNECYEAIMSWYFSHDHKSKDWLTDPKRVLKNLRSAVTSFYKNAELKGYRPLK
ncbi:MAG TPA: hypothetical protein PKV48_03730, partial [Thermodesulfobacteriota bacterium]|nr:hypothetical protein [Thermodesulfobacteriota bacterium]